uniref:ZP domain-containing protein n=1 Tax=Meloidogyne incognita TaxID=6306 RepID=A0A914KV83_MELIC
MVKTLAIILCILSISSTGNGAVVLQRNEGSNSVKNELAAYDNEIISEPEITCGPGVVHFTVNTRRGNASAVYVRGQSHNEDCTFHNKRNITIELAKCNVRRKREINPNPGIAYQMTIVVQLHPLFVTKVDRAYNVNCFYKEKPQDVSVDFGVSDIVTQQLYSEPLLPACTYSVHRDSPNGPRVKYTHVGEQLYHVWECPSRMYSMLLYNCQAVDGKGAEFAIIDANGCSKDEFLMPQITYTVERTKAMAASAAFNFPDRNTMSFTCKIKLCMNSDLECSNLTPPNCNGKRAKSASNGNFNEDTSGESSALLNATETPLPSSASTTPLSIITKTNVKQRVEVSGDVIPETEFGTTMEAIATSTNKYKNLRNEERIEEKTENSRSTLSSSTTSSRYPSSTTTESIRPDRNKPIKREESDEEQQRTSSSTPRSSSSTSRSSSSTTTSEGSEQLLSSVERMNSASAENSRETVASSTWSSSSTTEGIPLPPTLIATFHTTNSNNIISPKKDEFPQPDLLLHKDKAIMDEAVERADPNWTVSAEEVKQEEEKEKKENDDVFNGTTKPVQVFDKRSGNEAKSAARSQRDTTRGPPASSNAGEGKRAHNRRRGTHEVDFDISSPELMIMDDYEPAAAAQRGSIQRSSIQEAPFIDWSTQERGNNTVVCLSPIAIISGGLLLLLLLLIMLVILMRVMRKNRGSSGTLMEHSLYSICELIRNLNLSPLIVLNTYWQLHKLR